MLGVRMLELMKAFERLRLDDFRSIEEAQLYFDKLPCDAQELIRLQKGTNDIEKLFGMIGLAQDVKVKVQDMKNKVGI
jgi:hypothetical protein